MRSIVESSSSVYRMDAGREGQAVSANQNISYDQPRARPATAEGGAEALRSCGFDLGTMGGGDTPSGALGKLDGKLGWRTSSGGPRQPRDQVRIRRARGGLGNVVRAVVTLVLRRYGVREGEGVPRCVPEGLFAAHPWQDAPMDLSTTATILVPHPRACLGRARGRVCFRKCSSSVPIKGGASAGSGRRRASGGKTRLPHDRRHERREGVPALTGGGQEHKPTR